MVAFSTSVHLGVMAITMISGIFGVTLLHIITHAFVKATAFVISGVTISFVGSQDMRTWRINSRGAVIAIAFLLLTGVGGSMIFGSKEGVVLEMVSLFVVIVGWKYSKVFFNQLGGYMSGFSLMGMSLYLYRFIGR